MTEIPRSTIQGRDRTLAMAVVALAVAYCGLYFYFVQRAAIPVPVYDLLDWLRFYGERSQAGDWFGYLWTPHNEHRIVFSRILLAADVNWFGGNGMAFAVFGTVLLTAMVVLLLLEIAGSKLSMSLKAIAMPIAVMILAPASTVVTIGMPAMGGFLHTAAFAVFALVLMDGADEQGRFSGLRRVASVIAGCLAAFGVSGGLLILPVLIWSAWRGGLGWRWMVAIACAGGVFGAVYLVGIHPDATPRSFDIRQIVQSLDYTIRFLGLPWSHLAPLLWPARIVGLAILCVGGTLIVINSFSARRPTRPQRIGLALVLFTLLLAAAAGVARVDIGQDREMPIRYAMLVILAHVGLLLYAVPLLERFWQGPHRLRLQWLALGLSAALFGQQLVAGTFAAREADRYNQAWSRFVAGEWTPDMLHYVYPDRSRANEGLAYLRANHLPIGK